MFATVSIGARLGHAELGHEFDGTSEHGEEPEVAESSLVPLRRVSGLFCNGRWQVGEG